MQYSTINALGIILIVAAVLVLVFAAMVLWRRRIRVQRRGVMSGMNRNGEGVMSGMNRNGEPWYSSKFSLTSQERSLLNSARGTSAYPGLEYYILSQKFAQ